MYVPWTGLGLYNGFRGNRWLKNRIKIFKQFVVPSLQAQTNKNFTLWCSWRAEERRNPYVQELVTYLNSIKEFKTVHTFHGICFYDDKYSKEEARKRLVMSIHGSIAELLDEIGESLFVYMTIQPSDDCYSKNAVAGIQGVFSRSPGLQAFGFTKGYIMNYLDKSIAEYNPNTNPPFYTIKFPREAFVDPLKHLDYTALKKDVPPYEKGTPLPSHEYVKDCLKYGTADIRGFLVGTHSENISTTFVHPFKGADVGKEVLEEFGLENVERLKIKVSLKKWLMRRLPHKVQRKLRYIFGEKIWQKWYDFIRS